MQYFCAQNQGFRIEEAATTDNITGGEKDAYI